jgi:hypothetical protein
MTRPTFRVMTRPPFRVMTRPLKPFFYTKIVFFKSKYYCKILVISLTILLIVSSLKLIFDLK